MESTGVESRIQLSQQAANALIAQGKQHWLVPREDKIVAKGKGLLDTYFLNMSKTQTASTVTSDESA